MRLPKHFCVFINTSSISRIRQARISGFAAIAVCCLLLAGGAGIARIAWFGASYAAAKIAYCSQRLEQESLLAKLSFLDNSLIQEKQRLNDLARFEDRARLVYGLNPISSDVRKAGVGGIPLFSVTSAGSPFLRKTSAMQDSLAVLLREVQLQRQTFEQVGRHIEILSSYWDQRPSIWPVTGNVTSGFGKRRDPIYGCMVFHDGIDIACEIGSPVLAPADGVVKEAGQKQDYGLALVLDHPSSELESVYGHLSSYIVKRGQPVRRGEVIGYTGNSGKSTGPHLHYEIRENGMPVNAARFILPDDCIVD